MARRIHYAYVPYFPFACPVDARLEVPLDWMFVIVCEDRQEALRRVIEKSPEDFAKAITLVNLRVQCAT